MEMTPTLVTCALPYANGPLHLGHLVGYIQADVWVRARRMAGREVVFSCADDTHGTPIMLAAEKAGVAPEAYIEAIKHSHEADFKAFGVEFDYYGSTNSPENRAITESAYQTLRDAGHICIREVEQYYDPEREMFLPDRYVKGECPTCHAKDQYGDNCEVCGATYSPTDLINPRSAVSGATPILRLSEHYFFQVSHFGDTIQEWLAGDVAHPAVKSKLREWVDHEIRDWDISRDAPYFGFGIPGATGKFFYVWLDAPLCYITVLQQAGGVLTPDAELHHFLGKDIINFHGVFWPALLQQVTGRLPTYLHVNGYLTVNGAKMSKSRGTFIHARSWLDAGLSPEQLRYYFAAKSTPGVDDIDLSLEDFVFRVNSDLVGKLVNIASRSSGFITKRFNGRMGSTLPDPETYARFCAEIPHIQTLYETGNASQVLRIIAGLCDEVNRYLEEKKPWGMAKDPALNLDLQATCTQAVNLFRVLAVCLAPVVPEMSQRVGEWLGVSMSRWEDVRIPVLGSDIAPYCMLMTRVDPRTIESLVELSKETIKPA